MQDSILSGASRGLSARTFPTMRAHMPGIFHSEWLGALTVAVEPLSWDDHLSTRELAGPGQPAACQLLDQRVERSPVSLFEGPRLSSNAYF